MELTSSVTLHKPNDSELFNRANWLSRLALAIAALILAVGISGCCGPIGPGCHSGHCHDCDGTAGRPIPYAPFQNIKRQLICGGGGCGEVYVGEWISTPPDCVDPCCHDQFVGGAVPSRPFCWEPGSLLDFRRLSVRFDEQTDCCDTYEGGEYVGGESYFDEGYIEGPVHQKGSAGCSTCSQNHSVSGRATQFARTNRPLQPTNGKQSSTANAPRSTATSNRVASATSSQHVTAVPRTGSSRNRVDAQAQQIRR